jgi:hypothetical protein
MTRRSLSPLLWLLAMLAAVLAVAAHPASASAAGFAQTRVGASELISATRTGVAAELFSTTTTGKAAVYDGTASGDLLAADTTAAAVDGGDHLVLGLENAGTQDLADQVGGRTLIGKLGYQQDVLDTVANPAARLSVNLNGLDGEGAYSQVMTSVQRGMVGNGATNWELLQVYQAGRMGEVTFYSNGATIGNPFS